MSGVWVGNYTGSPEHEAKLLIFNLLKQSEGGTMIDEKAKKKILNMSDRELLEFIALSVYKEKEDKKPKKCAYEDLF